MSDFVQFETNVPQELALAYDDGKLVETRFGDKVFYTLVDGRTLSVTPNVSAMIAEKGIGKRQPFLMCKAEVRKPGAKKSSIEWRIQPAGPALVKPAPLARNAEEDLSPVLQQSIDQIQAKKALEALGLDPPDPPELKAGRSVVAPPPASAPFGTNGHSNGNTNGHTNRVRVNPALPIPPTKIPLNEAVAEAVQIVQRALQAAGEQWSDGARQDLVSTIIIQAGREGWLAMWGRP